MKIVADENVDKEIVDALRLQGHDVIFIAEMSSGVDDTTVLLLSNSEGSMLLTADKDFGDLVYLAC